LKKIFFLRNVKNETSYFENGLKNRFRAIAFRADEHFPNKAHLKLSIIDTYLIGVLSAFKNAKLEKKIAL
jgi:hypothetical protein